MTNSLRTAAIGRRSLALPKAGSSRRCLPNIALSVLDEHFTQKWEALGPEWTRAKRRRAGEEKTRDCHIDEGFDFLAWRIQPRNWRGRAVKTGSQDGQSRRRSTPIRRRSRWLDHREDQIADSPSSSPNPRRPVAPIEPDAAGLVQLFQARGVVADLQLHRPLAFWRIRGWLKKRHVALNMHNLVRRYLPGWRIHDGGIEMFRPNTVALERYRYRGAKISTPGTSATTGSPVPAA